MFRTTDLIRGLTFGWPALALLLTAPSPARAQFDLTALQDEAVQWLQEYIRINTINPPGNETAGAEFFARIFEAASRPGCHGFSKAAHPTTIPDQRARTEYRTPLARSATHRLLVPTLA